MSEHTPGPWTTESGISQKRIGAYVIGADGKALWDDNNGDGGVCSFADARLIAAAPELLAALQDLIEWTPIAGVAPKRAVLRAKAIIAKATGA